MWYKYCEYVCIELVLGKDILWNNNDEFHHYCSLDKGHVGFHRCMCGLILNKIKNVVRRG